MDNDFLSDGLDLENLFAATGADTPPLNEPGPAEPGPAVRDVLAVVRRISTSLAFAELDDSDEPVVLMLEHRGFPLGVGASVLVSLDAAERVTNWRPTRLRSAKAS